MIEKWMNTWNFLPQLLYFFALHFLCLFWLYDRNIYFRDCNQVWKTLVVIVSEVRVSHLELVYGWIPTRETKTRESTIPNLLYNSPLKILGKLWLDIGLKVQLLYGKKQWLQLINLYILLMKSSGKFRRRENILTCWPSRGNGVCPLSYEFACQK